MMSSLKLRTMKHQQESDEAKKIARLPTKGEAWFVCVTSLWFFIGMFIDGWAHNHVPELETFFTPWHAIFYSGYIVAASTFLYIAYRNAKRQGAPFRAGVPQGYEYALLGIPLFAIGGVGDVLWHQFFGIETSIDALLSPTHLLLAISMFFLISANLRSWFRATPPIGRPKLVDQLPMLFSLSMCIGLISFMTQFSHMVTLHVASTDASEQALAITGYVFHSAIFMGALLLSLSRARLARGALTLVMVLSFLPMAFMRDGLFLMPIALVTGIIADVLASRLHPLEQHHRAVRAFGALVPMTFFTGYFFTAYLRGGIAWSVHMWTGSVVMSGLVGVLVTMLVLPPVDGADA